MDTLQASKTANLIDMRDKFVKLRTILKNKIHSVFGANDIMQIQKLFALENGYTDIEFKDVDDVHIEEMKNIIIEIKSINARINDIDEQLSNKGIKTEKRT
jgi:hypothetical protein